MHVRDLVDAGLVDDSWLGRLTPEFPRRPKEILDNPE